MVSISNSHERHLYDTMVEVANQLKQFLVERARHEAHNGNMHAQYQHHPDFMHQQKELFFYFSNNALLHPLPRELKRPTLSDFFSLDYSEVKHNASKRSYTSS